MDTTLFNECHPAMLAAMKCQSEEDLTKLVSTGVASPYPLGQHDVHLPPQKITGHVSVNGVSIDGHFTGWVDAHTGKLRIDHCDVQDLWVEIDIADLMTAYLASKESERVSSIAQNNIFARLKSMVTAFMTLFY